MDSSKFNTTQPRRFAGVDDFNSIVVDADPNGVMAAAVEASVRKPQLIVANA